MSSDAEDVSSADAVAVGLEECVQLLQGPSDERRFVGLLLATKLLPAGNEHVMLTVYEAVGSSFLTRLLLPLKSSKAIRSSPGEHQKVAAAAGLGLAVLAGLCRVPQLGAASEVIEKIPLFLKVIRAGGISPILQHADAQLHAQASDGSESADHHAVGDALECLVQVVAASDDGCMITLQSDGIMVTAQALQVAVALNQPWKATAVQLLALLLSGAERSELLAGCSSVLSDAVTKISQVALTAVPALSQLFSAPPVPGAATSAKTQTSAGAAPQAARMPADAAALQLEALQVLLMVLPLPMPQAQEASSSLSASAAKVDGAWARDIHSGLYMILASRVAQQQRHSALRLAAAVLELVQPQWLLGPVDAVTVAASVPLFQVLVEILKVETALLLNDALAVLSGRSQGTVDPTQAPSDSAGPSTSVHHPASQSSQQKSSAVPSLHNTETQVYTSGPVHRAVNADASTSRAGCQSHRCSTSGNNSTYDDLGKGDAASDKAEASSSGKQHIDSSHATVEARVAGVLPAVLSLLEGCLEALASDAQDSEASAGGKQPCSAPTLDDRVAQRAMQALSEAFETILQFLELVHAEGSGASQDSPWLLAAIRAYGRFMAEVPGAHGKRVQALLAWLVTCQGGSALPFLLPGLLLCSQPNADSLEAAEPGTHKHWQQSLLQPQVLTAVVQHVVSGASVIEQALQAQSMGAEHVLHEAEAELAAVAALLQAIMVPEPASLLSQPVEPEVILMVKPAVQALTSWAAAHQKATAANAIMDSGLVASVAMVCAVSLSSAALPSSTGPNQGGKVETWSPTEAAYTFEVVLWALSTQYAPSHNCASHSMSESFEQMQLAGGSQGTDVDEWTSVLEVATTLVENGAAFRKQAYEAPWVRQCLQHNQRHQSLQLQLFLQAGQL